MRIDLRNVFPGIGEKFLAAPRAAKEVSSAALLGLMFHRCWIDRHAANRVRHLNCGCVVVRDLVRTTRRGRMRAVPFCATTATLRIFRRNWL
jgi:hypothetical protein